MNGEPNNITTTTNQLVLAPKGYHYTALFSLICLFLLCILWELWLAPIKPGGSLLFLKAVPLAFAIRPLCHYTLQWSSMLVLLYLMEGVVRVMSDPPGPSILLAWFEILFSTVFFFSAILYVRPAKRAAKSAAKLEKEQGVHRN